MIGSKADAWKDYILVIVSGLILAAFCYGSNQLQELAKEIAASNTRNEDLIRRVDDINTTLQRINITSVSNQQEITDLGRRVDTIEKKIK